MSGAAFVFPPSLGGNHGGLCWFVVLGFLYDLGKDELRKEFERRYPFKRREDV
jgi:hypothetical protein